MNGSKVSREERVRTQTLPVFRGHGSFIRLRQLVYKRARIPRACSGGAFGARSKYRAASRAPPTKKINHYARMPRTQRRGVERTRWKTGWKILLKGTLSGAPGSYTPNKAGKYDNNNQCCAHPAFALIHYGIQCTCVVLKGRPDSLWLFVRAADAVVDGGSVAQGMLPCTKSRVRFPKCDYI